MNAFKTKLVALFIALSLCVTWFYLIRVLPLYNSFNSITPCVFCSDVHGGGMCIQRPMSLGTNRVIFFLPDPTTNGGDYKKVVKVWRPRVAGIWLAGHLLQMKTEPAQVAATNGVAIPAMMIKMETFQNVFGLYHTGWLLLTFSVLIAFEESPVFIVLAVFAGMMYYLTPPDNVVSYPWDMPSMFFFTLACLLWMRGWFYWMLATIVLGTAFKETVAVTAFLFFFTKLKWKQKAGFFGAAFVACLLLKLWITQVVMGHAQIWTANLNDLHPGKFGTLVANVANLVHPHWNHFVWTNAGMLVVAFVLPAKTRLEWGIKTVLAVFCVGQFFAGNVQEFREFLDVLPISVIYLSRTIEQGRRTMSESNNPLSKPISNPKAAGIAQPQQQSQQQRNRHRA